MVAGDTLPDILAAVLRKSVINLCLAKTRNNGGSPSKGHPLNSKRPLVIEFFLSNSRAIIDPKEWAAMANGFLPSR